MKRAFLFGLGFVFILVGLICTWGVLMQELRWAGFTVAIAGLAGGVKIVSAAADAPAHPFRLVRIAMWLAGYLVGSTALSLMGTS